MNLSLKVWRQNGPNQPGQMVDIQANDVSEHMSFLEMLDVVNEELTTKGQDPIAFDHDCREGICGACSLVINGQPHGPDSGTTACQLHMRRFRDGDTIAIEPWRVGAFPVIKDLIVDRGALDRIVQKGGFITSNVGGAPDANAVPIPKELADESFDAAVCIGCGACAAACPNASAMLFVAAKAAHLAKLPQGAPERLLRAKSMVDQMDAEGFGACTNHYECMEACPKSIDVKFIAQLNRDYTKASSLHDPGKGNTGD